MKTRIEIFDTTLRDGMQGTGINYTLKDKLEIAQRLDDMGLDYIEGGFPQSNEVEAAFFDRFKKSPMKNAKLCAFGSTRKPGKKPQDDHQLAALLDAETPAVVVVGKTWKAHVTQVLGTTLEENLVMAEESVAYLKSRGREVIFDLEHFFDGWKDDPDYALQVLAAAARGGADRLVLCDTNGGTLVPEVSDIVARVVALYGGKTGVHFHNDLGLGVANSLAGAAAGARHIQGTINGWGERCGNANLCTIAPALYFKMGYSTGMDKQMTHLTELSRYVSETANIIPDRRQPFVGEAAFSHKAGQHADVIAKAQNLMEHMEPSLVGNTRRILLSSLAGKSTIVQKLGKYGDFDKNSPEVTQLTTLLKDKERLGYEYEAAEASFEMLILKVLGRYQPLFALNNYHLESFKTWDEKSKTVGRMFLTAGGRQYMGSATGIGPVGVLDHALRDALGSRCPWIGNVQLTDFAVRVVNAETGASESSVRVFITLSDRENSWDTVGVSENIVEASWEALVDGYEYYAHRFAGVRPD